MVGNQILRAKLSQLEMALEWEMEKGLKLGIHTDRLKIHMSPNTDL